MQTVSGFSTSRKGFLEAAARGGAPPLFAEIPFADPASVYPRFSGPMSLLFESARGHRKTARYSFIGFEPYAVFKVKDGLCEVSSAASGGGKFQISDLKFQISNLKSQTPDPLSALGGLLSGYRQEPDRRLPPFQGGAAGLISYDFVHYLEKLPKTTRDDLGVPDAHMLMLDRLIAFDHVEKKAWAIVCPGARRGVKSGDLASLSECYDEAEAELARAVESARPADRAGRTDPGGKVEVVHDMPKEQYTDMVRRVKEYIAAGDIFQANVSLRVSAAVGGASPWDMYLVLREINPSPFAGFMDFGGYSLVSSSPERLVMLRRGVLETRPIAGTRPRGADAREDGRLRSELLLNDKERAEHIMLIDLERNDLGRVCQYGSVAVDELMTTEEYSHVMHIVSNVRGRLAPGMAHLDALRAAFPGGTITGVPKVRCMEIIDELEPLRRGPYTGSMGYMGFSGDMDLNIIIRTILVKGGRAYVQAGAGVVADSEPEREYGESLKKAEALIRTLERTGGRPQIAT